MKITIISFIFGDQLVVAVPGLNPIRDTSFSCCI